MIDRAPHVIVDERYWYRARDTWIDLATGRDGTGPLPTRPDEHVDGHGAHARELAVHIDHILRAAQANDTAGVNTLRLAVRDVPLAALLMEAAWALRSLGFVAVRADLEVPDSIRSQLAHRHLVLFAPAELWEQADMDRVCRWIQQLTITSPRSHLLVLVREVFPVHSARGSVIHDADAGVVAVDAQNPIEGNDWGCGRASVEATVRAATRAMLAGRLKRAESTVAAVIADQTVRRRTIPAAAALCRAELLFWSGRFEQSAAAIRHERDCAGIRRWRMLIDWARAPNATCPDSAVVDGCGNHLEAAIRAQRKIDRNDRPGAHQILEARLAFGDTSALECALLKLMRARCTGELEVSEEVDRFVRTSGTFGLLRWGLGRTHMNWLHGITTLLQVVQEADDECIAMRHGCSWVREHVNAEAVGIVEAGGAAVVAGSGLAAAELMHPDVRAALKSDTARTVAEGANATVAAPMRYGGATIGFAIVRGHRDAAETLGATAAALASVCAPALRARLDALALSERSHTLVPEILGRSPSMAALRHATVRAAGTNFSVLIEGESGTGKELIARAVHRLSARRDHRFSALNCAALTDDLLEAELFGYARGAFTGAVTARAGLFEESHRSTLFLDEVTELSPRGQAKLLRVLQEREIRRVGEHLPRAVDVRVVAATNVPLAQAVAAGRFREDLLFRLAVVRIRVPPLRERIEDVPLLASAFWRELIRGSGKRAVLGADTIAGLCRHRWPGNVRELQNVIAGLVVVAPTRGRVTARHVQHVLSEVVSDTETMTASTLDQAREAFERRVVASTLARHGGRSGSAARELGLSRQGLAKAMKRLGIRSRHTLFTTDGSAG